MQRTMKLAEPYQAGGEPPGHKIRLLSNIPNLVKDGDPEVQHYYAPIPRRLFPKLVRVLLIYLRSFTYDVIFLNCATPETVILGILKRCLPFSRSKIAAADLILRVPEGRWERIKAALKCFAFHRVDRFILFHKDTSGYGTFYGIHEHKVVYVPFKINALASVTREAQVEGDYIFSGGTSLRDWKTLLSAMNGLAISLMLLSRDKELEHPDTLIADIGFPEWCRRRLRVIRDDGSQASWIRHIAHAKFVVLSICSQSIAASGISTYLVAMALKKCVIITDGPATRGILNEHNSVTVPPGDPQALRRAIVHVNSDPAFRRRIAEAGYEYATSNGDEARLYGDFLRCIRDLVPG